MPSTIREARPMGPRSEPGGLTRRTLLGLVLLTLVAGPFTALPAAAQEGAERVNVELILDASGSMAQRIGGETRMTIAKRVLHDVIAAIPEREGVNVGFRLYGHRGDNSAAGKAVSCRSSELLVPIDGVDKAALDDAVDGARATGWTPLATLHPPRHRGLPGRRAGRRQRGRARDRRPRDLRRRPLCRGRRGRGLRRRAHDPRRLLRPVHRGARHPRVHRRRRRRPPAGRRRRRRAGRGPLPDPRGARDRGVPRASSRSRPSATSGRPPPRPAPVASATATPRASGSPCASPTRTAPRCPWAAATSPGATPRARRPASASPSSPGA